jgi:hypothetical protein
VNSVNANRDHHAERSLLSALLIDGNQLAEVSAIVAAEDFDDPLHRRMFRAMQSLDRDGKPIDATLIRSLVPESADYMAGMLSDPMPRGTRGDSYARRVAETSRVRHVQTACAAASSAAGMGEWSRVAEHLEDMQDACAPAAVFPDLPDATDVDPIRWSWGCERLYPAPGLTMVYGGFGAGKSTLLAHLALALRRGDTEVLGCGVNERHRPELVLWVACEDPPGFVRGHYLDRTAAGMGCDVPRGVQVVYTGDRETWGRKLGLLDVPMLIDRYRPGLIVLDYWNGLCRMPEGQEFSIQSNFDALQDLRDALWQRYKVPALLAHHYNAQGKRSGLTQLANSCDQIWHLKVRDSGMVEMACEKSRGDAEHTFYLVRDADPRCVSLRPADREERRRAAVKPWEPAIVRHLLDQPTRQAAQSDLARVAGINRRGASDSFATTLYMEATGEKTAQNSPIWRLVRVPDWYEEAT